MNSNLKCADTNFLLFGSIMKQALILARILGRQISLDNIQVFTVLSILIPGSHLFYISLWYVNNFVCISQIESLYPKEMGPDVMTVEDFLSRGLLLLDKDIQERVEKAASNGNVLRYVCVIEGPRYLLFPPFFVFNQALVLHLFKHGFLLFHFQFNLFVYDFVMF